MKRRGYVIIILTAIVLALAVAAYYYKTESSFNTSYNINKNNSNRISNKYSYIQNKRKGSNNDDSNDTSILKSGKPITQNNAVDIVKKISNRKRRVVDSNIKILFDHEEKKGNQDYYVIHSFDNMQDHGATTGWYYVNKYNGKVYNYDLTNNKLILIK